MTLTSSMLQIRRHEYSGDLNIVILIIFVGIAFPFSVDVLRKVGPQHTNQRSASVSDFLT
ncbi:transmembrane protein, putative [Medicago truncatula]|uniref:Transmembrane protein, putative n=1 Tax=Medicago truncatula TaxID=3880 RepID=A0A072UC50_MEDTR|nr:transmembrane protein, putative [Medicago truncatula]